jgi:SAM-dependent methyltransferase
MSLLKAIKHRAMKKSREEKVADFYDRFAAGMTVLDVGVTCETQKTPPLQNYFLKTFPHDRQYYTGLGIDDLSSMGAKYPGATFVSYRGGRFPFADKQFDCVFSNAVIEHVGDNTAQLQFVDEMLRVGRSVFFTTPNKFFPVESHTNLLFVHWNDRLFYWWCRVTGRYVREQNLKLFSKRRLRRLMKASRASNFSLNANKLYGMPMTFTVKCTGR